MHFKKEVFVSKENFKIKDYSKFIICADIGGTKTDVAIAGIKEKPEIIFIHKIKSAEINNFVDIINETLRIAKEEYDINIDTGCFAAAGPVKDGFVKLTNLDLTIDKETIIKNSFLRNVKIMNDFEALANGLKFLNKNNEKDIVKLNKNPDVKGDVCLLGAGTGLGVGFIIDGEAYASEAGHMEFPAENDFECNLVKKLKNPEYEDLVSGKGLVNIYQFLHKTKKTITPEEITDSKTLELFVKFYARAAKNMVLMSMSKSVYLAGGIAPRLISFLKKGFIKEFVKSKKMSTLLKKMPVYVIMKRNATLLGAASAI